MVTMTNNRDRFLEDGYLIVREAIPPDELEAVRTAYEVLVGGFVLSFYRYACV
ncbi:uncharacterized protein METZ01_LOCUS464309 [marine metagenome]|uniref:Uncharacterized protein n=1 Tax=marine metagenome TaxID=408172 RepID=A0A383AWA2_9ZZZZ